MKRPLSWLDPFEVDGEWWRLDGPLVSAQTDNDDAPSAPDAVEQPADAAPAAVGVERPEPWPAYGTLRFDPTKGLQLELLGAGSGVFADPEVMTVIGRSV